MVAVTRFKRTPVDYKSVGVSQVLPDQGMSVKHILERFIKGVPAMGAKREPVYVDQKEYDLEKLSRLDFADKVELSQSMREQNDRTAARIMAAQEEAARRAAEAVKPPEPAKPVVA